MIELTLSNHNFYKKNLVYKIISVVIDNVNITFHVDIIICEMSATEVICTDHVILKQILTAHSDLGVNMGIIICHVIIYPPITAR